MRLILKIQVALAALLFFTFADCHAQSESVEQIVNGIVAKHENTPGVSCMTVTKGSGLNMVKSMLNKQLGKDFMKGVTSITIIDYTDASPETCDTLHKDLDSFISLLQEFDLKKEKQFSENKYIRSFASASEGGKISDFVMAIEDGKSKTIMYMAGTIKVE